MFEADKLAISLKSTTIFVVPVGAGVSPIVKLLT
jgi:hypothetical protein